MSDGSPVTGNLDLLDQGRMLLADLSDGDYAGSMPGRSSAGAQYRHILDHYQVFLAGLTSGVVDYDARAREPALEADRTVAARRTGAIRAAPLLLEDRGVECDPDFGVAPSTLAHRASSG